MGDRGNICMLMDDGNELYFYSHWKGGILKTILKNALIRGRSRWTDEPYLARIIFSEMIKNEVESSVGYGISTYLTDNENPIVYVSVRDQTITIDGFIFTFKGFIGE